VNRRQWLRTIGAAGAVGAILASPIRLLANVRDGFKAESMADTLRAITGGKPVEESDAIVFQIPDIAENGAVVPVSVSTELPDVTAISIVIENNPNPLASRFEITADSFADVSTRIKMGESSMVRAYVETPTKILTTGKEVKVTIGGCGG